MTNQPCKHWVLESHGQGTASAGIVPCPWCEIERLQGQVLAIRKALWDRDEYERGSASSCLEEIEKIVGTEPPYTTAPAVDPTGVLLDDEPKGSVYPANPYFRTCLKGHVAYSVSFSECPSCKIERERNAATSTVEPTQKSRLKFVGTLPPGMSFDEHSGIIFGIPTAPGRFEYQVAEIREPEKPVAPPVSSNPGGTPSTIDRWYQTNTSPPWFYRYQALVSACMAKGYRPIEEDDPNYGGKRTALVPIGSSPRIFCDCPEPVMDSRSGAACCGKCRKALRAFRGKGSRWTPEMELAARAHSSMGINDV